MREFRLATILGFEIRIHFSWFLIVVLLLVVLAASVFPAAFPGFSRLVYMTMALVGTLLFFASLLVHELAHALVARARSVPVEGITLFLFGGVARTVREAETPRDEVLIAAAGPAASLLLALAFGAGWAAAATLDWSVAVSGLLIYLGFLNLVLAIFNMLPGFPMDGGRIFRALVWKVTDDMDRATRVATAAGRWVAYALIGLGAVQILTASLAGGLWMVLIGFFLRRAAILSYENHRMHSVMDRTPASDAMTAAPETVAPDLTLLRFIDEHFVRGRFAAYPVVDADEPVGLISLRSIREVPHDSWAARTVGDVMSPLGETRTVQHDDSMSRVAEAMRGSGDRRVLVLGAGGVVGIITARDLAHWFDRARQSERM